MRLITTSRWRLVECGARLDERMTFWVRPYFRASAHCRIQVADAASTVDEAALEAALSRALVPTALAELVAVRHARSVSSITGDHGDT